MKKLLFAVAVFLPLGGCEVPDADDGNQRRPQVSFDPPVGGAELPKDPQPKSQTSFANVDEALSALSAATDDGDRQQQIAAYNWLCKQGKEAVPKMAAAVDDAGLPIEARRLACGVLGALGPEAAPVLIEVSGSDEPMLRLKAIETMPSVDPPQKTIIQRLMVLMDDSNEKTQLAAIRALGNIGTAAKASADKLIAMQNNPSLDESLRDQAARSLRLVAPRRKFDD